MRSRTRCLKCLRAVMSVVLPRGRRSVSTPPHARRDGDEHDSHRSRGHRSPLPPRRRPAWTATQGVRRENSPCAGPYQFLCQTGARMCARLPARRVRSRRRARRAVRAPRAPRGPHARRHRDVLRHLRRPRARRGLTVRQAERPARAARPRDRRGAGHGRGARPPRLFDDGPARGVRRSPTRSRCARSRRSPRSARARSRSPSSTPTRRPSCGSRSRRTCSAHTPLHGRVSATAVRGYDRDLERVERCSPRR